MADNPKLIKVPICPKCGNIAKTKYMPENSFSESMLSMMDVWGNAETIKNTNILRSRFPKPGEEGYEAEYLYHTCSCGHGWSSPVLEPEGGE